MNETIRLLRSHRSIRRYTDDEVPEEHVVAAVEAGQAASTSGAVQAYSLLRVRDADTRAGLAALSGDQEKVVRAGAFFVVCADARRHRLCCERAGVPYEGRLEAFLVAVVDASLFAQNLCVAFESLGYGICYVGGLRNRLEEVDRLLEIPEQVFPLFGLCVGRPDQQPLLRPRLPLPAVLFEERYPDDATMLEQLERHDVEEKEYLDRRGADPKGWTDRIAGFRSTARRTDVAAYYEGKGADLT